MSGTPPPPFLAYVLYNNRLLRFHGKNTEIPCPIQLVLKKISMPTSVFFSNIFNMLKILLLFILAPQSICQKDLKICNLISELADLYHSKSIVIHTNEISCFKSKSFQRYFYEFILQNIFHFNLAVFSKLVIV